MTHSTRVSAAGIQRGHGLVMDLSPLNPRGRNTCTVSHQNNFCMPNLKSSEIVARCAGFRTAAVPSSEDMHSACQLCTAWNRRHPSSQPSIASHFSTFDGPTPPERVQIDGNTWKLHPNRAQTLTPHEPGPFCSPDGLPASISNMTSPDFKCAEN